MKDIELSLRMSVVAGMVECGSITADIGCDHAFVSIYLVTKGISDRVIASDVKTGPCSIARDNIKRWNVQDKVELRLGDGLSTISPGEVDTIIIAGMGGMLITDILASGVEVVRHAKKLILQPQSELEHVRRYLYSQGFAIEHEEMLVESGKYYVVMDVNVFPENSNNEELKEIYFKYGRSLIVQKSVVLKQYLEEKLEVNEKIYRALRQAETERSALRTKEIEKEICYIQEALSYIGN